MTTPPYIGYNPNTGVNTLPGRVNFSTPAVGVINKIAASMAAAKNNNPVESLPWAPMTTLNSGGANQLRANSTAYVQGNTYMNAAGTHWFVVRVAGTSAASEPASVTTPVVATDPYNMGDITDGSATVNWMGPVRVTAVQPGGPIVTAGAKATQLTQQVYIASGSGTPVAGAAANTSQFRFLNGTGGFNSVGAASQALVRGSSTTAALRSTQYLGNYTLPTFGGNMIEFVTDATLIAMDIYGAAAFPNGLFAGQGIYIEVDGRRVCDGLFYPTVQLTQNNAYQILDFRTAGPRKNRTIRVAVNNIGTFSYIWVSPQDTVTASQNPNRYTLAVVGDSEIFGSNSSPILAGMDMVTQFAELVGNDNFANLGVGGTGFVYNGAGLTYIQRLADVVALNPDVVWIQGAYNDSTANGVTASQLLPAALAYYQALRAALPNALIIQAGTGGGVTPTVLQAVDAVLAAAVAQFNDNFTFFVPASTATPPWFSGTGYLGGTNGSGNSDIYVGPSDTTHPSQLGVAYMASKMAQGFQNLIQSLVTSV